MAQIDLDRLTHRRLRALEARRQELEAWLDSWGTFRVCPVDAPHYIHNDFGEIVELEGVEPHVHMGSDIEAPTWTPIRAPFDGYVEKRLVNLGELVKTQMPVMAIVRVDPLKVTAEIPEKMGPWIKNGQPVELHVDAYPTEIFTGTVSRISPAVNTATRAFPFEALIPNKNAQLKPGTFARVHIESGKTDEVMTLPYAALQYRYGVNRAFVVAGDKLAARELKVGDRMGDRIEIVSGVKAGEQVAISDVEKLVDGTKVTVK